MKALGLLVGLVCVQWVGFCAVPVELEARISVELEQVTFEEALDVIADKTKVKFNYNRDRIPVNQKVSLAMRHVPAITVLQELMKETGTRLLITGAGQIAVVPGGKKEQGGIRGTVMERDSGRLVPGVSIMLKGTDRATLSDEKGNFKLMNLRAGQYTVICSAPGFKRLVKQWVFTGKKGAHELDIKLETRQPHFRERIEVLRSFFQVRESKPVSMFSVSGEEVGRAPGSANCVSRMLRAMPGVTAMSDVSSEMIVRGGSPLENGFYIDNIEVPNINHLPASGSNGGAYSALNPVLISNIDVFSGGFASNYGGHLSSVTEITFREGRRDRFGGQVNLNSAMGGGVLEGPFAKGRGTLMVSFRKSWLTVLQDVGINLDSVPETVDSQIKLTFDASARHKFNGLYLLGRGTYADFNQNDNIKDELQYKQYTMGLNWTANWTAGFFSNTSLSYSSLKRSGGELMDLRAGGKKLWDMHDTAHTISLRNLNYLLLARDHKLEFGIQVKHDSTGSGHVLYDYTANTSNTDNTDNTGGEGGGMLPQSRETHYSRTYLSLFGSYVGRVLPKFTATLGVRGDYSRRHGELHVSPRLLATWQISEHLALNSSFGIFYQPLPLNFLAYSREVVHLRDMKAMHYILGLEYIPGPGTKISLEAYSKEYGNLPVNPDFPMALFSDWLLDPVVDDIYGSGAYFTENSLSDDATGYARGVELLLQNKFSDNFYGLFSASFFRSRYKDPSGVMHNRLYDNCYVINLSGLYKPGKNWEISARLTFMGGAPYTPTDFNHSMETSEWTLDESKFHRSRYPSYSTLNLKINKRFIFNQSSLLVYLEILNLLDRDNVQSLWWNNRGRYTNPEHQLPLVPLLGIEFHF